MSALLYILGALGVGGAVIAGTSSSGPSRSRPKPPRATTPESSAKWKVAAPPDIPAATAEDFRSEGPPESQWAELVGGAAPNTVGSWVSMAGIKPPPSVRRVRMDVRIECRLNCRGSGPSVDLGVYQFADGPHAALHVPGMATTWHLSMGRGPGGWRVDYLTANTWYDTRVTSQSGPAMVQRIAPLHLADDVQVEVVPSGGGVAVRFRRGRPLPAGNKRPIYRWDIMAWEIPPEAPLS